MRLLLSTLVFLALFISLALSSSRAVAEQRPNVLFIAVDDLNHWVGFLGRNPQARTPNFDRLASMGVAFTNAHCAVPACEPSRCALMGGRRPWTTGCYKNGHRWKQYQPSGDGLSAQFLSAGYRVSGAGKIYHSMDFHPDEWTDYMSKQGLSSNGPGVNKMDGYFNDVQHPNLKDDDLIDWHSVNYCIKQIEKEDDQPFFVACGLYKPHLPFVAPRKYYEPFPLDEIQLPPHLNDDLDDIPPAGIRMAGPNKDHAKFLKSGRWKAAIQSYLATCSYADMNLGRLLDGLEKSGKLENTIICLWTDHGWSLGEKQHWRKFALWEETTRTPMIWVVPGLTQAGSSCSRSVDAMSIYPTLCELASIEVPSHVEGKSIASLLRDPSASWDTPAITTHGRGNHSVRTDTHRYIRYADGSEELYDCVADPYEWKNLASDGSLKSLKKQLAAWLPKKSDEIAENPKGAKPKKVTKSTSKK